MTIASEIAAGLAEAGAATGAGPLILTFTRAATGENEAQTPDEVETETPPTTFELTAVDTGIKNRYDRATGITFRSRVLLVEAMGTAPLKSDTVSIGGVTHHIMEIEPVAPGGVPLLYKVHLEA